MHELGHNNIFCLKRKEEGLVGIRVTKSSAMSSPPPKENERSDLPSAKREMSEEERRFWEEDEANFIDCIESSTDDSEEEHSTDEYIRLYKQEIARTGVFEIDFSKLPYWFDWRALDLDDSTMVEEPETDRDFIAMLLNVALTKHNTENKTSLGLGKITRTNFHLSAGLTFYISFEAIDGNQTIPYQAVVRHMQSEIEVYSCNPKPSS